MKQSVGTTRIRNGAALAIGLLISTAAGCAATEPLSQPLTDRDGMTLYILDEDERGSRESTCYGGCAEKWPPVPAANAGGEDFGSITRADGTRQLTYKGQPVYYYAGDSETGDMNGDDIGGVWHAIRSGRGNDGTTVDIGNMY